MEELFSEDYEETVEYDEPLEDHSDDWWKLNYSNLRKFETDELHQIFELPSITQRFKGLVLHILSLRKRSSDEDGAS